MKTAETYTQVSSYKRLLSDLSLSPFLLLILAACGGGDQPVDPSDGTQKGETENGGGGGTITVPIIDDGVQITRLAAEADGGDISVSEAHLAGGSNPSPASLVQAGTFTVDAPDGVASLSIGGVAVITGGVFKAVDIAASDGVGTLSLTGFDDASGVVRYSFTLLGAVRHAAGAGGNDGFVRFAVALADEDGNSASSTLVVRIVDDVPEVTVAGSVDGLGVDERDLTVDATADMSDNFSVTAGADGGASIIYALSTVAETDSGVVDGATGRKVYLFAENGAVVGRVGAAGANGAGDRADDTGAIVFTLSVDADGRVALDQSRLLDQGGAASVTLAADVITLSATVTDGDGDTATQDLALGSTISFADAVPVATDDADSVAEDGATLATGNVFTGVDRSVNPDVNKTDGVADSIGADGFESLVWDDVNSQGEVAGTYGTLTVGADGAYSYQLDNDAAAVQGLGANQTVSDVFSYTLTDGDGSSDTATLTITIKGADDGVSITDLASGGDVSVSEAHLAGGSNPTPASLVQAGTFTLSAPDGVASLSIGGVAVITNGVFKAVDIAASDGVGTLSLTGFDDASGVVRYSFTLLGASRHAAGAGGNDGFVRFAVALADEDGNSVSSTLVVRIVDDVPAMTASGSVDGLGVAERDLTVDATADMSDNFSVTAGADGQSGVTSYALSTVAETDSGVIDGATGRKVYLFAENGAVVGRVGAAGANGAGDRADDTGAIVFTLSVDADGRVALDQSRALDQGGAASVTLAADVVTLSATVTDGDGDTATQDLALGSTISFADGVPVATHDVDSVAEDGARFATGNVFTGVDRPVNPDVNKTDGVADSIGVDGFESLVWDDVNSQGEVSGTYGTLTVGADGAYSYQLDNDATAVQGLGANQTVSDVFSYTLTDRDGSSDTATLTITITGADDGVSITDLASGGDVSVSEAHLAGGSNPSPASLVQAGTFTLSAPDGVASLTIGGVAVITDGTFKAVDIAASDGVGTLRVTGFNAASGEVSYSFTLSDRFNHGDGAGANDGFVRFAVALADEDSNSVSSTLVVRIVDDVPAMTASGSVDGLGVAERDLTVDATADMSDNFSVTAGADGQSGVTSYALSTVAGTDSGVIDGATGRKVYLFAENGAVVGRVGAAGANGAGDRADATGAIVFTLSVDADGRVALDQGRALDQGGAASVTLAADVITLSATVTDGDGDVASQDLALGSTISFADGVPVATHDVDSVAEDGARFATGNVFTGVDRSVNPDVNKTDGVADSIGVDGFESLVWDDVNSQGEVSGTYGTLTVTGDGEYSYQLDNDAAAVQGLGANQTVSDVFSYTLTDRDGSSDTATLTITITGADDGVSITDLASGGDVSVNEAHLAGGSNPSPASLVQAGTFTLSAPDGLASLSIGGVAVITNGLFKAVDIAASDGVGTLSLTGFDDASGVVRYSFTLLGASRHAAGAGGNDGFVRFAVALADEDGNSASSTLVVRIVDDVPAMTASGSVDGLGVAERDLTVDATADMSDNFSVTAGADGQSGVTSYALSTVAGTDSGVIDGATGRKVYLFAENGAVVGRVGAAGANGAGDRADATGAIVFTLSVDADGRVALDQSRLLDQGGAASVTLAADVITLSATVTDGDGDVASQDLALGSTISFADGVPVATHDVDSVAEDGARFATGNVFTGVDRPVNPDVNKTDGVADSIGVDGFGSIAWTDVNNSNEISGTYGTLTVTGDGEYSYQLDNDATAVQGLGANQTVSDVFSYTLTDRDGSSDTATLTITITGADDGVSITDLASGGDVSVNEAHLAGGSNPSPASLVQAGTFTVDAPDGLASLSIGGVAVITNGVFKAVDIAASDGVGTLSLTGFDDASGVVRYSFTLLGASRHAAGAGGNDGFVRFAVALADEDGNSASSTLVVRIVDDVPAMTASGSVDGLGVAERDLTVDATADMSDNFSVTAGADGQSGVTSYALSTVAGTDSGVVDGATGRKVYLFAENGAVVGRVGAAGANGAGDRADDTGAIVFTLSVDADGRVALDQGRALDQGGAASVTLAANVVTLSATVTDGDGDTATQDLALGSTISFADGVPVATHDVDSVAEDGARFATGNVFTGVDRSVNPDANSTDGTADSIGVDGFESLVWDDVNSQGEVSGTYGTLTVGADGAYSYQLDNDAAAVQGLGANQTVSDVFSYTLTDRDGSSDTATLTITITGADDGVSITDLASGGDVSVSEAHLAGGSNPTPASLVQAGTFTLSAPDGVASLTIGGVAVITDGTFKAVDIAASDGVGTLRVTGFNAASGEVSYSFTLSDRFNHGDGAGGNDGFVRFAVALADEDGNSVSSTLVVRIVDDVPAMTASGSVDALGVDERDLTVDATADMSDNFSVTAGADGGASIIYALSTVAETDSGVVDGATGRTVYLFAENGAVVGRVGAAGANGAGDRADDTGAIVFTLSVDADGRVTLDQSRLLDQGGAASVTLAADVITLSATVTDGDGDTATQDLALGSTISFADAVPVARDDSDSVTEDGATLATGNVFTGVDRSVNPDVNKTDGVADSIGADGFESLVWDAVNSQGEVAGTYGVLTVGADGAYSYQLDNDATAVQGLGANQTVSDVFSYTLTDRDGSSDTATLTITITGADDGVSITDLASGGDVSVNEAHLAGGSNPSPASLVQAGTFTLSAPDGLASLSIGGVAVITNGLFKAVDIAASDGVGTLSLTGFDDASGVVRYSFTLLGASRHAAGAGGNDGFVRFAVALADEDGNSASSTLVVRIVDDVPAMTASGSVDGLGVAERDLTVDATADMSDNFSVTAGADGQSGVTSYALSTVAGTDSGVVDGATGRKVYLFAENGAVVGRVGAAGANGAGDRADDTGAIVFTLSVDADGRVALDQSRALDQGGAASVTLAANVVTLSATVTDGDGDVASQDLALGSTISFADAVPVATHDVDSVAEDGARFATGNVFTGVDRPVNPDVNKTDGVADSIGVDGFGSIAWTDVNNSNEISGTYGTLTVTGDGEYSYQLDNDAAAVQGLGANQTVSDVFSYTLTDRDGSSDTATLTITITGADDGVSITDLASGGDVSVNEAHLAGGSNPTPASLVQAGTFTLSAPDGVASLTIGGVAVITDGTFKAVDIAASDGVGTLRVTGFNAASGEVSYSFTLSDRFNHGDGAGGNDGFVRFAVALADEDGNSVSSTLVVRIVDDVPAMTASGSVDALGVDERDLTVDATADMSDNFSVTAGADGQSGVTSYALSTVAETDSGVVDGATGRTVYLFAENGAVVGRVGAAGANGAGDRADDTGAIVFTLSVDADGRVTLDQSRLLDQGGAASVTLAADVITLSATVTDGDGDVATQDLALGSTISFADAVPVATDDADNVAEDGATLATGNVFTGVDRSVNPDVNKTDGVADSIGVDGFESLVWDAVNSQGEVSGTYGTLTVGADGAYSYQLDNDATAVQGLGANQTVSDVFSYTLTDRDGSSDTATLTITITGADELAVSFTDEWVSPPIIRGQALKGGEDGFVVYDVSAATDRAGASAVYSLKQSDDHGLFMIDAATGAVRFKADHIAGAGSKDSYNFTILARVTQTGDDGQNRITVAEHEVNWAVIAAPPYSRFGILADGVVNGNGNNNPVWPGPFADSIKGGQGIDTASYFWSHAGVSVVLDGIQSTGGNAAGDGLRNIENLIGSRFDDSLTGNVGDNRLEGGDGDDVLDGGAGNDTASYADAVSAVTVSLAVSAAQDTGGAGTDTLTRIENLLGSAHNDRLTGNAGANMLEGGAGSDTASYAGAVSAVTVSLAVSAAQDTGGAGTDTLTRIENLLGSAHNDRLTGNAGANTLEGGAGDDTLDGGAGSDTASYAGAVSAVTVSLAVSAAQDTGGAGTDTLTRIENLLGSVHNDRLTGDAGTNTLTGGAGDDTLGGGAGADTLTGGAGSDTASYAGSIAAVTVDLSDNSNNRGGDAAGDRLTSIENLIGSAHDDVLTGDAGANRLDGRDGDDRLDGGAGDDTLLGGAGNDSLEGGAGDDTLDGEAGRDTASYAGAISAVTVSLAEAGAQDTGGAGTDTLTDIEDLVGSAHNDDLTGDAGANTLYGGAGDDTLTGGAGADILLGGDGDDTLNGQAGDDTLRGGAGHDILTSVAGNDILEGGAGSDRLHGGIGDDIMDGGTGFDIASYRFSQAGITVSLAKKGERQNTGGEGWDTLSNIEALIGSNHNDRLTGDDGFNQLQGRRGDDSLDGGAGFDYATYTNARSGVTVSLAIEGRQDTVADGWDTLVNIEALLGSRHNDRLTGDAGENTLLGGAGNDTLDGGAGDDTLEGGAGDDRLDGGAGSDTAAYARAASAVAVSLARADAQDTRGAGTDTLTAIENLVGSAHNDTLTGDAGDNRLDGGGGDDILRGRAGDDSLIGGAGADTLDGGAGSDTASYAGAASAVTVSLAEAGAQDTGGAGTDTLINIENLIGSAYDDSLIGDNGVNRLDGGDGDDTLRSSAGNDTLIGGAGGDIIDGGADNDTASYVESSAGVTVDLSDNSNNAGGDAEGDVLTGIENLIGSAHNDDLTGDTGANMLEGGAGDDSLDGGDGNDTASYESAAAGVTVSLAKQGQRQDTVGAGTDTLTGIENLRGTAHNDTLIGGAGGDSLVGGAGDDSLNGGAGGDSLVGGAGNDTLIGGAGADTLDGGAGYDTASYAGSIAGVRVDLSGNSNNRGGDAAGDRLTNIENVIGSAYNDDLTGDAGANKLEGGDGHDGLTGGAGDDTLDGGTGYDLAYYYGASTGVTVSLAVTGQQDTGGAGRDSLRNIEGLIGSRHNDMLTGDAGDNHLDGRAGDDIMDGGAGTDTASYQVARSGVTVSLAITGPQDTGGAGRDTLRNIETLIGSIFSDRLTGDGGDNLFVGNGGDDIMDGGAGFGDRASYQFARSGVTVSLAIAGPQDTGGDGRDTLVNIENLIGSAHNDTLIGDGQANRLEGGGGDDIIDGGADNDTASYESAAAGVTVSLLKQGQRQDTGGAGWDTLHNIENLIGSAHNDILAGDFSANRLIGGAGFDFASYSSTPLGVTLDLTKQNRNQDTGGVGSDWLSGIEGLIGSRFNDGLGGDDASNYLIGGAGHDLLTGRGGDDIIDGGAGYDIAFYDKASAGVTVDLTKQGQSQNTVGDGMDTLRSIEGLIGSAHNDRLTGDGGPNQLSGGGGDDIIDGGAGIDHASYQTARVGVRVSLAIKGQQDTGGAGRDTLRNIENLIGSAYNDTLTGDDRDNELHGYLGDDTLDGGAGFDTASYVWADKGVEVSLARSGRQSAGGGAGQDTLRNIEALIGSDHADRLHGDGQRNELYGRGGNDTLFGQMEDDRLDGGEGNDRLEGGEGNDRLDGGAGDDHLYGGEGSDTLIGGVGNDTLVGDDSGRSGQSADKFVFDKALAGTDTITDFTSAAGDRIQIDTSTGTETTLAGLGLAVLDKGRHAHIVDAADASRIYIVLQDVDHNQITDAHFDSYFEVV